MSKPQKKNITDLAGPKLWLRVFIAVVIIFSASVAYANYFEYTKTNFRGKDSSPKRSAQRSFRKTRAIETVYNSFQRQSPFTPEQIGFGTPEKKEKNVFEVFLNPETSKRDNFGELFRYVLRKAGKAKGNFLEIGGGDGKFFDHNMEAFGDIVRHYVIIEPYKLFSPNREALPTFMERIVRWQKIVEGTETKVEVIHDFSYNKEVYSQFPDGYFDFIYIDGDHSYKGAKGDLINFFPKVRVGGVIAGHDYCCSKREAQSTIHAPWCGRYIWPLNVGNRAKHGREKASFCGIFIGAEEFAKANNFYWLYTLEGRYGRDDSGFNNPSYFTIKFNSSSL